jgi:hypothetical protein
LTHQRGTHLIMLGVIFKTGFLEPRFEEIETIVSKEEIIADDKGGRAENSFLLRVIA